MPIQPQTSATSLSWAKRRGQTLLAEALLAQSGAIKAKDPLRAARPCATSIHRKRPCSTRLTPPSAASRARAAREHDRHSGVSGLPRPQPVRARGVETAVIVVSAVNASSR